MFNLFGLGLMIKKFYDAEQMKWDNNENEYVAPLKSLTLSKCNKIVANSYDTYAQISS